jgi:hypothetical protein
MEAQDILAAIAPELANDPNKAAHINLADGQTGSVYGDQRDHAVALLAAHTLTLANRGKSVGGVAGAVSSLSEGQLSVGFSGSSDAGKGSLGSTSYGEELLRLRRQCIMGARTRAV